MKTFIYFALLVLISCSNTSELKNSDNIHKKELSKLQKAYFASGCFWCVEGVFEAVNGVEEAISGYTGGNMENPTYEAVCTGKTGHAETVEVYYDSTKISYKELLTVFFDSHDPSTLNQQGPDKGTQYRSGIFYRFEYEKVLAQNYKDSLIETKRFDKITTEISPLIKFWEAEKYHQNYKSCNPNNGYVQAVSVPRLEKFKLLHPEFLKK